MSHPSGVEEPEIEDLWARLAADFFASRSSLRFRLAEGREWRHLSGTERRAFRGIVRMAITGRAARLHEKT